MVNPILTNVIQEMEQEATKPINEGREVQRQIIRWLGMLQAACLLAQQAAQLVGPKEIARPTLEDTLQAHGCDPQGPAKAAARKGIKSESGLRQAFLKGGPHDNECLTVPGEMPCGAKTAIGASIYVLGKDGCLHYSEKDTEEIKHLRLGK